jgi:hypothetical protein
MLPSICVPRPCGAYATRSPARSWTRSCVKQVTEKLARVFQVDPSKQRLDSVHIKSNMRRLGRLSSQIEEPHYGTERRSPNKALTLMQLSCNREVTMQKPYHLSLAAQPAEALQPEKRLTPADAPVSIILLSTHK